MSDQENSDSSPRPKRTRFSRPFQVLSLPSVPNKLRNPSRKLVTQLPPLPASEPMSISPSVAADNRIAGVIKKLQLTNFMCHGNFEIEFNPRINFISGANGSGKSAIQTAIVIGLGGQASKTNRSSKIEGLIKHGCHAGSVSITLTNTGSNAYKPDEYGEQIKIVRNITPSSSTYKIYSQWDKLISNKKAELDLITTRFKIQPNNPVSVLNQDMARNFLSSNKAEDKYTMFKKATLLDEAEELLNNINAQIDEQKERIKDKEKTEEIIDKEIAVMDKKMQLVEELKETKRRKEALKDEFMWAEVHVIRKELIRLEEIYEEQKNNKIGLEEKLNEIKDEIAEKNEKIEELQRNLFSLQNESKSKEEMINKYRAEFRQKKDCYHEKYDEYQQILNSIKHKKVDKDQLKASLDDIEKEENEQKSRKEEAQNQITQLQSVLEENDSKMKVLQQEISRIGQTLNELVDMKKEKERRVYSLNEEIRANERQAASLKTADNLSVYGQWMPTLVARINEAVKKKKFSKPPKGPLGKFIEVKQGKWMNAIESYLGGGFLSSFFVNNTADRHELYKIMNQVVNGRNPTVHVSQFQEKSRSSMLPQIEARLGSHLNMYTALKINDHVVANFLMDMRNIHQILLIEESSECRKVMTGRNWVRNCSAIINLNADTYLEGCRYYANTQVARARLLQKSVTNHIESLKEEIEEKKQIIAKEKVDMNSLSEQFNAAKQKVDRLRSESDKYRNLKSRNERHIHELKRLVNMEMPSLQTKIEELTSLEKELIELENRKTLVHEDQTRLAEEMNKAKKYLDKCGIGDTAHQQSLMSEEIETLKKAIELAQRRKEGFEKKIDEQNVKINTLKTRIEEAIKKTEDKCSEASTYSQSQEPDSDQKRDIQEVRLEMEQCDAFIAEAEGKIGTKSITFEKDFITKQMSQRKFKKMFTELKKMHSKYRDMRDERKATICNVRDLSSTVVYTQFVKVITSRNYQGQLVFDHTKGRLEIELAPPDSGESYMKSESLSGGEKSVSTVAFLMALWSNMDLPFYSMDEYDVFMDAINRRTITGLLTSFAADKSSRQFIFLTPLDVSLIKTGPNVTVHRVKKIM